MRLLKAAKDWTTLDHIRKELKIQLVQNKIDEHRQNCTNNLARITNGRIPKLILQYKPTQRPRKALQKKKWNEYVKSEQA